MKKSIIFIIGIIFLCSLVLAQDYKMSISTSKETFQAGENITLKVSLFDSQNLPVKDNVLLVLEDAQKRVKIEKTVLSNEFVDINLLGASYGQGKITATYQSSQTTGFFIIEASELVKFEINEDNLVITNIGNTQYTRTIQITIGDVTGIKTPKLDIGKSVSYRLVAPPGVYNIRISDGKTTLTKSEVQLTGTGKAIGALDESASERTGITGGISPDEQSETSFMTYVKGSKFVYVFIGVIFMAVILLAIERQFKRKASKEKVF